MTDGWFASDAVFDGQNLLEATAIEIRDGAVSDIAPISSLPNHTQLRHLAGLITPGFVDLQVNGGSGVLFNHEPTQVGIAKIAAAHHSLGTVAFMPTVITDAPEVLEAAADAAIAAKGMGGFAGLHIEGPHIDPHKRGTHDAQFIRPMDGATLNVVERLCSADVTVMITVAPEAITPQQITKLVRIGVIVSLGHSNCTSQTAEASFAAGATCVTHLFNAMSQMEGRAPGLTGAAIASDAYVGMICDGVHVADEMLALALRARTAKDRSFIVSDAMPTVGGPDRFDLYGQEIRLIEGKLVNAEGNLAGAHTTMADGVARLVQHVGLDAETALRMAITTPANLLKSPYLAQLTGRKLCDVIVLDEQLQFIGDLQSAIDNQAA